MRLCLFSLLTIPLLVCSACSFFTGNQSTLVSVDRKVNPHIAFEDTNHNLVSKLILTEHPQHAAMYSAQLQDCGVSSSERIGGRSRQLLVGFSGLRIIRHESLSSGPQTEVVMRLFHANVSETPADIVAFTWKTSHCLHDFLVWTFDPKQFAEDQPTLDILTSYALEIAQSHEH